VQAIARHPLIDAQAVPEHWLPPSHVPSAGRTVQEAEKLICPWLHIALLSNNQNVGVLSMSFFSLSQNIASYQTLWSKSTLSHLKPGQYFFSPLPYTPEINSTDGVNGGSLAPFLCMVLAGHLTTLFRPIGCESEASGCIRGLRLEYKPAPSQEIILVSQTYATCPNVNLCYKC